MSRPAPVLARLTLGLGLLGAPALAQAPSPPGGAAPASPAELAPLITAATDENRAPVDRERSLGELFPRIGRPSSPAAKAVAEALVPMLGRLEARRSSEQHERLIGLTLRTLEACRPVVAVAPSLRAFLRPDASMVVRRDALRAVWVHAVPGLSAEVLAVLKDIPVEDPQREATERMIVEIGDVLPVEEGVALLAQVLEVCTGSAIRGQAAGQLGERRVPASRAALVKACRADQPDEVVACESALALERFGGGAGVAVLVERLQRRDASQYVYRCLCQAAHRPEGFAGVSPGAFNAAGRGGRTQLKTDVLGWWEERKGRSGDDLLLDALAARGVQLPADRKGKDVVGALIDGLEVDTTSLRYAALDRLVDLTGRADLLADFRVLERPMGGNAMLRETEPAGGFPDEPRRERLRAHQRQRAERFRTWWRDAAPKATLVNGVWVVAG